MQSNRNDGAQAKLHDLEQVLRYEIRGQMHVIPRVVSVLRRGQLGLSKPGRPRGSLLLLGPTGVGKTELTQAFTRHLFGAENLIRSDMSEFQTQESLRPEIFARITEKLVFHRLSYEHQLEIAEKFLALEVAFLRGRGHELTIDPSVLPFLVRKGFHPKLGARPMRDAVEKLVGDAVATALLAGRNASGSLLADDARDGLTIRR